MQISIRSRLLCFPGTDKMLSEMDYDCELSLEVRSGIYTACCCFAPSEFRVSNKNH